MMISNAGATSIDEAIRVNKTLTNWNLSDNGINNAGATSIVEAMKVNKTLIDLDCLTIVLEMLVLHRSLR